MHDDRCAVGVEDPVDAFERYLGNDELELQPAGRGRHDVRHVAEVMPVLIVEAVHAAFGIEMSASRRERRLTLSDGVEVDAVRAESEVAHRASDEESRVGLAERDRADGSAGGVTKGRLGGRAGRSDRAANSAGGRRATCRY